jgi:protein-L-isoaspartate(D-aspartate) O-methyltransferase
MSQFAAERAHMILGQVRTNDVQDPGVIAAMESTPREAFVPPDKRHLAYSDVMLALAPGRVMLDPRSIAKLLQLAQIRQDERVLEIGTGLGYATALLCRLSSDVVTVEEDPGLADRAAKALASVPKLGSLFGEIGPLAGGCAAKAPYDLVVVNGAIERAPAAWIAQVKPGGRVAAFERTAAGAVAKLLVSDGKNLNGRASFDANVPLLPGFAAPKTFVF